MVNATCKGAGVAASPPPMPGPGAASANLTSASRTAYKLDAQLTDALARIAALESTVASLTTDNQRLDVRRKNRHRRLQRRMGGATGAVDLAEEARGAAARAGAARRSEPIYRARARPRVPCTLWRSSCTAARLEGEIAALRDELEVAQTRLEGLAALEAGNAKLRARVDGLAGLRGAHSALENEAAQLRAEVESLRSDNAAMVGLRPQLAKY